MNQVVTFLTVACAIFIKWNDIQIDDKNDLKTSDANDVNDADDVDAVEKTTAITVWMMLLNFVFWIAIKHEAIILIEIDVNVKVCD